MQWRIRRPGRARVHRVPARDPPPELVETTTGYDSTGRSTGAPDVVGILPIRDALIRLVGAVLAEQHDEWTEMRRYIGLDVLTKSRLTVITTPADTEQEVTIPAITA